MYGCCAVPVGGSVRVPRQEWSVSPPDARRRNAARPSAAPARSDTPPRSAQAAPASPPAPAASELRLTVDRVVDTRGADRLRAVLEDAFAPGRRLLLDLGAVEHLSSAALAVIVSGHRRLRDGGGQLVLCAPSAAVVRELRISGLHRVIAVDPPEHDPA